jgi:hypothetical protein
MGRIATPQYSPRVKQKKSGEHDQSPVMRAATELQGAIDRMERLTTRSVDLPLATRHQLLRAGELLQNAVESHQQFLDQLAALGRAVEDLRARQNASAEVLAQCAARVEERRKQCAALDDRFAAIGQAAREISAQMSQSSGNGGQVASTEEAQRFKETMRVARERLALTVEEAAALTTDAREAGLAEIERQAHAMRQQLQSLLQKLDSVE